ncbi:aminoglycoside phosphotransferase family protein [Oceaniglobus roseus]|uniref:aminoglycoside phosphotransferase family protein n=1 Tax=Oceaniglobus roseus TaxID=1737570 RepID=UPI000C7F74A0|nr:phosphotransferase [Kandeliimicrobium roseum]
MPLRADALAAFLAAHGRGGWERRLLAGDASNRRYDRLRDPVTGHTEILMDAPPERGEDVRPFVRIARHLNAIGLAAPEIMAEDAARGFLLIEDFGDAVFARLVETDPDREAGLYRAAAEVLLALHRHPAPDGLPRFAQPLTPDFAALAWAWYAEGATGVLPGSATRATDLLNRALAEHADDQSVMILRDYHAENLVWRTERNGLARVGLLDFQDAMAGHPAYDLASLLGDARRDVAPAVREATVAHYLARSGRAEPGFRTALAVLGAQRNLRILGVFARLCLAAGKTRYLPMIPRVWRNMLADLDHPALSDLRRAVLADLPEPTPDHLAALERRCATVPIP